jgi:hypothetical protein
MSGPSRPLMEEGNGMNFGCKAVRLLSILPVRPLEFCDRVTGVLEVHFERLLNETPSYSLTDWPVMIEQIEVTLGVQLKPFLIESELSDVEKEIELAIEDMQRRTSYRRTDYADFSLARLYYLICRAMKPDVIVETGVARGVSSAFILKALEKNGAGILHSVDLPPLGPIAGQDVGFLVRESLKDRWRLHKGVSKRILPPLLREIGMVDVFIHDSLHTKANVRRELLAVAPTLAPRSVVIADDLHESDAFREWVTKSKPALWAAVRQEAKESTFGVCVFNNDRALH